MVHLCSEHQGGNIFFSTEWWACEILINRGAICLLAVYLARSVTGGWEGPDSLDSDSILTPARETERVGDSCHNAGVLFPRWEPGGAFSMCLATNRVSRQKAFPHPGGWRPATIVLVVLATLSEQTGTVVATELVVIFLAGMTERWLTVIAQPILTLHL